ncbi:NAD(P)/FAD-dependent oxidoreductase [Bittarella massiliensis (ex Durand et al. 2017)]|uniref:NAD(P)/FAD-dependent oxidoreductase n=1 Tax=Bittarella massiliensis (ex Durand et al. 2017) TaxID=1720313 RepID=UPI001AA16EDF|nr:NAD(P)/FAD-dependent oxidoreductase [Bittarella massiliensis (ex Durand et al. 2017)]MBO1680108.1 NAD(P)/FAD-dependent oxidoreductase [Bittarella massiliensis (ex Durand et al. 2017)]
MERVYSAAVIGGGPAGLMAAGLLGQGGVPVLLLEKNDSPGKKLRITGKGRCNLTNNCEVEDFLRSVPRNPRFLYSALYGFSPQDTMAFFEGLGVPLKTERGNRVFPQSDRAGDVVDALVNWCRAQGVEFRQGEVEAIAPGAPFSLSLKEGGALAAHRVVVATGGLSYPQTGSTGDGYRFARQLGHTVNAPGPSLVPLCCCERWCKNCQGLSLKNVTLTVEEVGKKRPVFSELGEMLFTHFGVSGPLVLSASCHMEDAPGRYRLHIDLKPGLTPEALDRRLLRDFEEYRNKNLQNALGKLLPQKLIGSYVALTGIPGEKKVNQLTQAERGEMVRVMKDLPLTVSGFRPAAEGIITRGGVSVREIDPGSCQSRRCPGLYFAGEVLDVDGYTGGFNLQIAFSTAVAAARDILALPR